MVNECWMFPDKETSNIHITITIVDYWLWNPIECNLYCTVQSLIDWVESALTTDVIWFSAHCSWVAPIFVSHQWLHSCPNVGTQFSSATDVCWEITYSWYISCYCYPIKTYHIYQLEIISFQSEQSFSTQMVLNSVSIP